MGKPYRLLDAAPTADERRMIMPKNVVCKKCINLVNDWCEKVIDSPDQDMQRDCQYFCEKTNADRIRAMSDKELGVWICEHALSCGCCVGLELCRIEDGIANGAVKWLQQPPKGE